MSEIRRRAAALRMHARPPPPGWPLHLQQPPLRSTIAAWPCRMCRLCGVPACWMTSFPSLFPPPARSVCVPQATAARGWVSSTWLNKPSELSDNAKTFAMLPTGHGLAGFMDSNNAIQHFFYSRDGAR